MAALTIQNITAAGMTPAAGAAATASDTVNVGSGKDTFVEYTIGATATTITVVNNGGTTAAGDANTSHVIGTALTNTTKRFKADSSFADSSANVTITTNNQTAVTVNAFRLA